MFTLNILLAVLNTTYTICPLSLDAKISPPIKTQKPLTLNHSARKTIIKLHRNKTSQQSLKIARLRTTPLNHCKKKHLPASRNQGQQLPSYGALISLCLSPLRTGMKPHDDVPVYHSFLWRLDCRKLRKSGPDTLAQGDSRDKHIDSSWPVSNSEASLTDIRQPRQPHQHFLSPPQHSASFSFFATHTR